MKWKTKLKALSPSSSSQASVLHTWLLYLFPSSDTGGWRMGCVSPYNSSSLPLLPSHSPPWTVPFRLLSMGHSASGTDCSSMNSELQFPTENLLLHAFSTCCIFLLTCPPASAWGPTWTSGGQPASPHSSPRGCRGISVILPGAPSPFLLPWHWCFQSCWFHFFSFFFVTAAEHYFYPLWNISVRS